MSNISASVAVAAGFNDIVKQGYMKIKGSKLGVWKKKWIILRQKSSRGPIRLEKFSDEKASMLTTECKKIMLDSGVSEIVRLSSDIRPHALSITFQDGTSKWLSIDSEHEINEWFQLLQDLAKPDPNRDELDWMVSEAQKDTFHVFMLPSPNLQFYGECVLRVSTEEIMLLEYNERDIPIVSWRLNTLRRYGRDQTKFTFEAGRASSTGEGLFIFNTKEGESIYKKVNIASVALVELGRLKGSMDTSTATENAARPAVNRMQSAPLGQPEGATCINNNSLCHSKSLPMTRDAPSREPPDPPPRPPENHPPPPPPPLRRDSNTSVSPTRYTAPPLPPMRPTRLGSFSSNASDTAPLISSQGGATGGTAQEPIYEEKYLTPEFRRFLAERKEPDRDNGMM